MKSVIVAWTVWGCVASAGCTKHNPDVCCINAEDCASIGFETEVSCSAGLACVDFTCIAACNNACSGDTPFCGTDNATCVGCAESSQCSSGALVCDSDTHTCRSCQTNADCESGACNVDSGQCLDKESIVYVASNGTLNGTCDQSLPCTFERGLLIATVSRPTMVLADGDYEVGVTNTKLFPLRIAGTSIEHTRISPTLGSTAIALGGGTDLSIRDVTMLGAAISCLDARVDMQQADIEAVSTIGCTVSLSRATSKNVVIGGGTSKIERSTISQTLNVSSVSSSDITVSNSLLGRLRFSSGTAGGGVIAFTTIFNGVVADPNYHSSVFVRDDIIVRPDGDAVICAGGTCGFGLGASIVFPQSVSLGPAVTVVDPQFTSATDFHLRATSPAIDHAENVVPPADDFDGNPRPFGARADLGAFEFH